MGNGPHHYLYAASTLERAAGKRSMEVIDSLVAEASAHAALAEVAAKIDIANGDTAKWKEVLK